MTWTPAALTERLAGDEKLARELIQIFLDDYHRLLDAVRTSVARGDAPAIKRAAHALKGSIANFVDAGPVTTARALEQAADSLQVDAAQLLIPQLEREVTELATAMRRSLENPSCAF